MIEDFTLMRAALGWFLILQGALFFCGGIGAAGFFACIALMLLGEWIATPQSSSILPPGVVVLPFIGLFCLVSGHLMMLFGQSMTHCSRQEFPERRPVLWFSLVTLRQLAMIGLAGSVVAIGLTLSSPTSPRSGVLPSLGAAVVLASCVRPLGRAVEALE